MAPSEKLLASTPRQNDYDRSLFEEFYQNSNLIEYASLALDIRLTELAEKLRLDKNLPWAVAAVDRAEQNAELVIARDQAIEALQKANAQQEGSWNDYYRLLSQILTIPERFQAANSFMFYDMFDVRRKLVDGVAGKNVQVIDDALKQYDAIEHALPDLEHDPARKGHFISEREEIRGVVSEHTIMALLNLEQRPSRLAVTSNVFADKYHRIDVNYFYTHEKKKEAYALSLQVKTESSRATKNAAPENGGVVALSNYDPSYKEMRLARLLVAQHNGEPLQPEESQYINEAHDKLQADILTIRKRTPGTLLPLVYIKHPAATKLLHHLFSTTGTASRT